MGSNEQNICILTMPVVEHHDEQYITIDQLQHLVRLVDQSDTLELEIKHHDTKARLVLRKSREAYYSAPSLTAPPFINVGDVITVGQTIALVEAMKVFSEIPSEVAGRVGAIKVHNGDVVRKGDILLQVEPV